MSKASTSVASSVISCGNKSNGVYNLLLGKSGSGKTTFTEIMLGFLTPNSGKIHLNNKPWMSEELLSKRINLGYVSQDIILFEGDLVENITLKTNNDSPDILQKINSLIELCALEDIVDSIGGVNGFISEGGKNLSAGQKQRIIIFCLSSSRILCGNTRSILVWIQTPFRKASGRSPDIDIGIGAPCIGEVPRAEVSLARS